LVPNTIQTEAPIAGAASPEVNMSTISYSPSYVRPVGRTGASRGQVRLTRRGRIVVLVAALLAALAVGVALASASASAAGSHVGSPDVHVVTVRSGETLWAIASTAADRTGTRTADMMQRIEDLNTLDDGVVYVGQELRVPNS